VAPPYRARRLAHAICRRAVATWRSRQGGGRCAQAAAAVGTGDPVPVSCAAAFRFSSPCSRGRSQRP